MQRREFMKRSLGAAAAFGVAQTPLAAGTNEVKRRAIRLGAPLFGAPADPEELALAHRRLGYRAAYCPHVALDDTDRIRAIREAFTKHNVVIAEVGRWCNLMDADPAKRAANLERVTQGLALAEEIDARCCVDIAGSFSTEAWYGPHHRNFSQDFFDLAVENARKIIDAVKPKRAKLGYEMMGWAMPHTVDNYLDLLRAIDRDGFGVHLDPCNAINCPEKFYDNTALLNDCFDRLGPWIVSAHAKDLTWDVEMNIHFREVVLGRGSLDYATYLTRLAALPGDVPLMIEHMKGEDEYNRSREHLFEVSEKVGVAFE